MRTLVLKIVDIDVVKCYTVTIHKRVSNDF